MKRWDSIAGDYTESPKIDAFLDEIETVCRKHGLSLSHEDGHGAFEVEEFSERNMSWLRAAHDATSSK